MRTRIVFFTLHVLIISIIAPNLYAQDDAIHIDDELRYWLTNTLVHHRYSPEEAADALGLEIDEIGRYAQSLSIESASLADRLNRPLTLPYPGGRHPRIGFLEGAINPMRGTKASVFSPYDDDSYVVIDLPEAIWMNGELLFLAHTHIPTMWDRQDIKIADQDWRRLSGGALENEWSLPNGVVIGASIRPNGSSVDMELWLENGSDETLTGLVVQVCVMLKGASGYNQLHNANKELNAPVAAVWHEDENQAIVTAWERCNRSWANEEVPCIHSDPQFADCKPGETVRLKGGLAFTASKDAADLLIRQMRETYSRP